MTDHISVSEALKLVTPFKDGKREVLAFIADVDTAFEVIDPRNADTLYKLVLTRIGGEPRIAIAHRNLVNWEQKQYLKNTYTEKRKRIILYTGDPGLEKRLFMTVRKKKARES
jgi:hypothetical protein